MNNTMIRIYTRAVYVSRIAMVNLAVLLLGIEISCAVFITFRHPDMIHTNALPTYLSWTWEDDYQKTNPIGPHKIDTSLPWCTIHPPGGRFRQQLPCQTVEMRFNAEGFRGPLPERNDARTTLFLGDSFTEGWGLEEDQTISAAFSRRTGIPVLNLGISGIGTTKSALLYEDFSKRYRHARVIVLLFLGNDFWDNDARDYAVEHPDTYMVYRKDTSDLDKLTYVSSPDSSLLSRSRFEAAREAGFPKLRSRGLKHTLADSTAGIISRLANLTYTIRAWTILQIGISRMKGLDIPEPEELKYDEVNMKIFKHDLQAILQAASKQGADVLVTNLPSGTLLKAMSRSSAKRDSYRALEDSISSFVSKHGGTFVSLEKEIASKHVKTEELLFPCDPHYNPYGAEFVAAFLAGQDSLHPRPTR